LTAAGWQAMMTINICRTLPALVSGGRSGPPKTPNPDRPKPGVQPAAVAAWPPRRLRHQAAHAATAAQVERRTKARRPESRRDVQRRAWGLVCGWIGRLVTGADVRPGRAERRGAVGRGGAELGTAERVGGAG